MKKTEDFEKEYEGKTLAELKKIKTKLLIENSEALGIFSVKRRKELQQRIDIVEKLMRELSE